MHRLWKLQAKASRVHSKDYHPFHRTLVTRGGSACTTTNQCCSTCSSEPSVCCRLPQQPVGLDTAPGQFI